MIQILKRILGIGPETDYGQLIEQGAILLDVRSRAEFSAGHIKNAMNIPVDELSANLSKLNDKDKCIICCCASGMRSGTAKRILESKGYKAVYNGGSWTRLQNKL
ncbi:rhodanese-like domain-containing protein [Pedobacter sp. BS3]|uniref:rhodanese-like domain-containing protein n=1 Tax=Pedobacter sp. BS3 TaxID=2567937 RepID=UPI0011ECFE7E|nr:rhodanese-like domain-containing protein [Pedobacter sp. BS3]TZF82639.1 rhodanese-like domain-containing protein [Pedobacter sp. BS3]